MILKGFFEIDIRQKAPQCNYIGVLFFFLIMNTFSQVASVYSNYVSSFFCFVSFFFIVVLAFLNEKLSIIGFVTLSLSSLSPVVIGSEGYIIQDFGTQRLLNVSMTTLVMFVLVVIKGIRFLSFNKYLEFECDNNFLKFIFFSFIFVFYSLLRQFLLEGESFYAFIEEFNLILVFLFSVLITKDLRYVDVPFLLSLLVFSSILRSVFLSYFDIYTIYGGQRGYVFDFCFDLIPALPLIVFEITKKIRFLLLTFFMVSIVYFSGSYIVGGKNILVFGVSFFLSLVVISNSFGNKVSSILFAFVALFFLVIFFNMNVLVSFFEIFGIDSLNYKLFQIQQGMIYLFDFSYIDTTLSVGNILAEIYTVFFVNLDNVFDFLFGKGIGGIYRDIYGFLHNSNAAYPDSMFLLNEFYRFHIPVAIVLSWGGIIGLLSYLFVVSKTFKMFNEFPGMVCSLLCLLLFFLGSFKEYFILVSLVYFYAKEKNCEKVVCS